MQGQYCQRGHGTKPRAYLCSKSKQVCQPCPPVSGLSTSITTSCFTDVNVKGRGVGVQNVTERTYRMKRLVSDTNVQRKFSCKGNELEWFYRQSVQFQLNKEQFRFLVQACKKVTESVLFKVRSKVGQVSYIYCFKGLHSVLVNREQIITMKV